MNPDLLALSFALLALLLLLFRELGPVRIPMPGRLVLDGAIAVFMVALIVVVVHLDGLTAL
jgi:hypothetical protein